MLHTQFISPNSCSSKCSLHFEQWKVSHTADNTMRKYSSGVGRKTNHFEMIPDLHYTPVVCVPVWFKELNWRN